MNKEYKCIRSYVEEQFSNDLAPLAAEGWRVIHIQCETPYVYIFLERDKEEQPPAAMPQATTEQLELLENTARKIKENTSPYSIPYELADYLLMLLEQIRNTEKKNEN